MEKSQESRDVSYIGINVGINVLSSMWIVQIRVYLANVPVSPLLAAQMTA